MIRYRIGESSQVLVLTARVVTHFTKHCQNRWLKREAGGQLFARLTFPEVVIEEVTGPRRTDRRGRHFYVPDRQAEQLEIEENYQTGLHYVGDWHTHPTPVPQPSSIDLGSINECFDQSEHNLNGFLLIIVGTKRPPEGLLVSVNNANGDLVLKPHTHVD